jgi:hypothetical protein
MFNCFNNFWVYCLENNNRLMLFEITSRHMMRLINW